MTGIASRVSFVVYACPKSGTTWVQRLISAHPSLCCGESSPFGLYHNPTNPTGTHISLDEMARQLTRHKQPPLAGQAFTKRLTFELWDGVARAYARQTGARVYGEKFTPFRGTADVAVRGLAEYGGLRCAHLVRDGRDVVASAAAHQLNIAASVPPGASPSAESPEQARRWLRERRIPPYVLEVATRIWIETNRAFLNAQHEFPGSIRVRYEDLLEQPEVEAMRLLRFVAGPLVDVSEQSARDCVAAASFETLSGGRARGQEDATSFFRKGVRGDWVHWFTPDDYAYFLEVAAGMMSTLGYDTAGKPARLAS
ncbi:MAG: sulfotransferase domain-containing protein [Planctomycetota bacterium]